MTVPVIPPIDLSAARARRRQEKINRLVLDAWDEFDRQGQRALRDRKETAHFAAKERL